MKAVGNKGAFGGNTCTTPGWAGASPKLNLARSFAPMQHKKYPSAPILHLSSSYIFPICGWCHRSMWWRGIWVMTWPYCDLVQLYEHIGTAVRTSVWAEWVRAHGGWRKDGFGRELDPQSSKQVTPLESPYPSAGSLSLRAIFHIS